MHETLLRLYHWHNIHPQRPDRVLPQQRGKEAAQAHSNLHPPAVKTASAGGRVRARTRREDGVAEQFGLVGLAKQRERIRGRALAWQSQRHRLHLMVIQQR